MKALTLEELAAVQRNPSRLVICCQVGPDRNGEYARLSTHDQPIDVDKTGLAGRYEPTRPINSTEVSVTSDSSTDNIDIVTTLNDDTFTEADIAARIFDDLPITWFATDWGAPENVGIILLSGYVGHVRQIGDIQAEIEIRGLKAKLNNVIVSTWGPTCKADLGVNSGEWPCDVDLDAYTVTGQITSTVVQRRVFTSNDLLGSPLFGADWFTYGTLEWVTGANAGYRMEVQSDDGTGQISLFEPMPSDFDIGDEFTVHAGCDKSFRGTHGCSKFGAGANLRFMGEPDIPGLAEAYRGEPAE